MRLRCVAVVSAFTLYSALTLQLPAQLPVRVVRHAPVDTARSGDVITISFDRPVVGSLDRTPDPAQIVRVEPPLDARIQWRDPTTLRIIPREPLTPARRYRVRVSNDFTAMDGGRLEAPYEFTLLTRGPRILASKPGLQPGYPSTLVPNGELRIVYSAPIDSTLLARVARLELTGERACTGRTIRYVVGAYREIAATDDDETRNAGGWGRDTIGDRFRRVVELRATTPPPDECHGAVVLPSFDPSDRAEIRYPVATQPRFALTSFSCGESDCPADQSLQFSFSAAVIADSLKSRFRLEPAVEFTL